MHQSRGESTHCLPILPSGTSDKWTVFLLCHGCRMLSSTGSPWELWRKMPISRPVSHVLTVLLHLGTSGVPCNQDECYTTPPHNGQCPKLKIRAWQLSALPYLPTTWVKQSMLWLPIRNPFVSTSLIFIWIWGQTCENCTCKCPLSLETHWKLVSIRPQRSPDGAGRVWLTNCTGNRK